MNLTQLIAEAGNVDINKIIQRVADEQDLYEPYWGDTLTGIELNDGLCDVFAEIFEEEYPGAETWGSDQVEHVWVRYKGLFYDAETLTGVKNWKELPFMQRKFNNFKKYPTDVAKVDSIW